MSNSALMTAEPAVSRWKESGTIIPIKARESVSKKYSTVSLFCGCGGLDLGFVGGFRFKDLEYVEQPFDVKAAYDFNDKCIDTYRQNISEHAEVKDLSQYDPREVPAAEVLIGGFPCQDFASCGPRNGLNSERGRLYEALLRYMDVHKPMVVVGENVIGLANIDGGRALETIKARLSERGYKVQIWTLFAPDYGVPQTRTRLFIVAVREDLKGFPEQPVPTHENGYRTLRWAIDDLRDVQDESIPNQSQYFRASKAKRGNGQGDEKSKADAPGYTVRANAKSRVQFHYDLERRLTVRECARIQTFPDTFTFAHSATTNIMQIGNAVPPMLAHAVSTSIARWLEQL
ncbi:DNA cytosine methyltransferase [Devosia sp. Naph2]|uniref:DNA cytosine methyltransferase n=1 Tax=Devosia polycyclovorans TaxID=3345148 RepID=UPI0035D03697